MILRGRATAEGAGQGGSSTENPAFWATLARSVGQGDREAEAHLAVLFHGRVRAMASARLHGSDAALDIAQQTILAVLEALRAGRLREAEKLPAFVLSTARNLVNSYHRTEARNRETCADPPDVPAPPAPGTAGLDEPRRTLVREALLRLHRVDRRILLLTLIDGMTPREISPIVGLRPDAVRTRKARALKAIRGHVKKVTRKRRLAHMAMSGPRP